MINLKRITLENSVYAAALLLGIVIRFTNLGTAPLSESEASLALQALSVARDGSIAAQTISPQPGYIVMTSWLFSMFGTSNFLARFWPAAAGSLLILLPWLISRPGKFRLIERNAGILMAFGLALTPGLVAASRQVGGTMMAVAFLSLSASLYIVRPWKNWVIGAGILGGLALLSGPAVIPGLITLFLVLLVARRLLSQPHTTPISESSNLSSYYPKMKEALRSSVSTIESASTKPQNFNRNFFVIAGLTILLVGSNFFRFPAGLTAWLDTAPVYLQGWLAPEQLGLAVPALRLAAALVIYQPIAVIFGLIGAGRSLFFNSQKHIKYNASLLSVWILVGLFLILAYPARQTVDVIWVLAPLWTLAAGEIQRYLPVASNPYYQGKFHIIAIVQAFLLILLLGLLWYTLASISRIIGDEKGQLMRYIVIIGIFALGALMTVLIQLGWSWDIARLGLAWGVLGGLALFAISALWGTAYLRANLPQELWTKAPGVGNLGLLNKTLTELSLRNTGRTDSIDIVSEVNSSSMRWLLRNFLNADFVEENSAKTLPSILITRQTQETPALLATYRGQDFAWWLYPGWDGILPNQLAGWLTFRTAPVQQESVILWARSDRFPGGILAPVENESELLTPPLDDENEDFNSSDLP